jgi:Flp pilus assembly protein TadD
MAWIAPVLVCLVALGVRLWYLDEARGQFDFEQPVVDAGYHDYWAWGMASGEWSLPLGARVDPEIASRPYFRPPLTAYWMAGLFTLFGHDHLMARIVQILLGTMSCLILMRLATRVFDRATGVVAGLLAATYWILVYFDLEYREVSLLVFLYPSLALAALRWRERPSLARVALAGGLLGISALARPNGLVFVPVVMAWGWWATREDRPPDALRHAGVFLLATAVFVLPVTVRNVVAGDELVLISSNGGINLYVGNNENATGTAIALPSDLPPFDSAFDYRAIVHRVGEMEGSALSDAQASRWFAKRALEHAADEPLRTLGLMGKKTAAFWGGSEIVSEKDLTARRRESTALNVVPLDVSFVIVSALFGLVVFVVRSRGGGAAGVIDCRNGLLLLALLGAYFLSFLPFFVTARFRAPMIPLMLVLSAFGVRELFGLARAKRVGAVVLIFSILVVGYALHRPGPTADTQDESRDTAKDLAAQGAYLASEGRLDEAETMLRRAVETDPNHAMARNNLGLLLHHIGEVTEAVEQLRTAVRLDESDPRPHQNLALALLDTGELQLALGRFNRAAELAPVDPVVALEAGQALLANGRPIFATEHLERASALVPDDPAAHFLLGVAYLQLGQADDAVAALERAHQLAPDDGRIETALEEARRATM